MDGQETSVKSEVEAAIAEAEALVANESVSQAEINQSVERLNQAVASVKKANAVTTETLSEETTEVTPVSSMTTPKVISRRALSEGNVRSVNEEDLKRAVVTKENFESFFQEGETPSYDKLTGTIKLTDDVSGLNEGDTIRVTATDAANNKSDATTVTVKGNVRPVVTIPYDDKANQIIYLYSGEEYNIELKITDNSDKISKAYLVFAQDNRTGLGTEDAGYLNGKMKSALYLKANPAIIKLTTNIPNGSYTDGTGMTRYIYAEDLAGNTNYDSVGAAGDTGAPGRIRFVWKPQTFKYNVQAPSTPIVTNTVPSAADLANAVKVANPTFSDKIDSVTLNGTNVTVTYKDGSTDTLSAASVFDIEAVAPSVTPVKNPSSLTTPEKDAVKAAVKVANPDATTVVVGNDGSTTLTYSNGSTANLTPAQTVKAADANGVQEPAAKTPVQNTSALTQPEKDAVKSAVETANPSATKVEVGDNGDTTVTFPDGTTATLTGDKNVKEADDKTAPTAPVVNPVKAGLATAQPVQQGHVAVAVSSKRSESGKLPNTGEEQSVVSIGLAILSALTGGLMISKKRKKEEE